MGTCIQTLGHQLKTPFGGDFVTHRTGALLEEINYWGQALRFYGLS